MTVLTVGTGEEYSTISAAVAAAVDGDTVLVQAGTYVNDFSIITHKITLQSVGGLAILQATDSPPNGKAIITTDTDVVIDGFGFTGASVGDGNGAGIRYEAGNLVVKNSVFWQNQEGLLSAGNATGTITIDNSEFSQNGNNDGYTHNLYVGQIASLVINNSYFHDAVGGHEIKSRAASTTITNSRIQQNDDTGSYDIDIPNGGTAVISNNVIEKGVNAPNYTTVHFGGEGTPYDNSSLTISNNTFVNDNENGFLLNNAAGAPVTFTNNSLWNYASDHVFQSGTSTVTQSGTTVLASRPSLDMSTMAPAVVADPVPVVTVVPPDSPYRTFGAEGAVTASGHILTVGAHGQFQSLAAALTASKDGDTIQVAAGTYTNDLGTVNHKVIIEGVGGIARFVQSGVAGPVGVLTVNTDVTVRNMEFTGGHGGGNGHEGGITVNSGDVTIVNTKLDDNDIGIYAGGGAATSVSVYGSEVYNNGNHDKDTHNIAVYNIGSFTFENSYVHDAISGHEIADHAFNTVIENSRIMDGETSLSSFQIGLGQGGNAIIRNNVIEKGHNSVNDNVILVGGEGTPFSNTNVQIDNNLIVSNMVWPDHPYTFFLVASADETAVGPVTASNNTFVGGVPGSAQAVNVQATGSTTAASAVLDTSSPVSGALAPTTMADTPSGVNKLTLNLSEIRGYVDAQFIVAVDGQVVGGGLITTQQGSGSQDFSFYGDWPSGDHTITVTGSNLYSGKTATAYTSGGAIAVNSISLDSQTYSTPTVLSDYQPTLSVTLAGTTRLPDFDAGYYLAHNPDVAASGVDPLTHYMTVGWKEGRDPSAWFSTSYYLANNPDVAAAGVDPLLHYEMSGWQEGRDPSPLFSLQTYRAAHLTAPTNVDPLQTYMQSGDTKVYSDPFINPAYYHAEKSSVAATQTAAADDYAASGWKQGLNPSMFFNTNFYLADNPDVAAAGIDPLKHYEDYGWQEGRNATPWFSTSAYLTAHPELKGTGVNPYLAFLESSDSDSLAAALPYMTSEAKLFDWSYYLTKNPDVMAAHVDPLAHYEQYGWHEGRDPSATFDTDKYLATYSDVKAADMDPLLHYATYGIHEGRQTFPV